MSWRLRARVHKICLLTSIIPTTRQTSNLLSPSIVKKSFSMKSSLLVFAGAVLIAAQQILPTIPPTGALDPWVCATANVTSYINVPATPTGPLLSAMFSYGSKIATKCTATTSLAELCPPQPQSSWCAFSTAIPGSLNASFTSYVSVNRKYWTSRSSAIASVASACPNLWWNAMIAAPNGGDWFTQAVYHVNCNIAATPINYADRPARLGQTTTTTTAAQTSSTASAITPTSSSSGASSVKGPMRT